MAGKYDVNESVREADMNLGSKESFLLSSCKLQLSDKKQPGEYKMPPVWSSQHCIREAIPNKKSRFYGHFPYGGGAQPHSIAFGGVLTNFTEAIFG